jgi:hypothetical protein
MLAMILFSTAIGIILGSNFRIFVLGPAILFASSATLAAGFVSSVSFATITLAVFAVLASLQIGYVVGGIAAAYFGLRRELLSGGFNPSRYY